MSAFIWYLEEEKWGEEDLKITRISLKPEYVKIQRKRVEGSQQRIEDGVVYFTVSSRMQILNVRTFVLRFADLVEEVDLNKSELGNMKDWTFLTLWRPNSNRWMI